MKNQHFFFWLLVIQYFDYPTDRTLDHFRWDWIFFWSLLLLAPTSFFSQKLACLFTKSGFLDSEYDIQDLQIKDSQIQTWDSVTGFAPMVSRGMSIFKSPTSISFKKGPLFLLGKSSIYRLYRVTPTNFFLQTIWRRIDFKMIDYVVCTVF